MQEKWIGSIKEPDEPPIESAVTENWNEAVDYIVDELEIEQSIELSRLDADNAIAFFINAEPNTVIRYEVDKYTLSVEKAK